MQEWLFIQNIVVSALLGGLIGLEREMHDKPAGFRTHVLVCMGAAMFTTLSLSFAGTAEVSRIAAGVVTGIGFLAAGSIFRDKNRVRGLTTAADIWVVAAIGMTVGFSLYFLAAIATAIALVVLTVGRVTDQFLDNKIGKK